MTPLAAAVAVTRSHRGKRVAIPAPVRLKAGEQVPSVVRCAVYTRQSVEDRTDNGFTSLDAQREAGEAFVASMKSEGWIVVPSRYDDGGFSGGNTERPALKRLLQDITDGKIDTVIVYKIDRLSRSLLDFLHLVEFFEQHQVAFVAVTQQINTATSAGKLMLHILASFASYERAIISERTSDKMCAARRKGKYMGGPPPLGYDLDREHHRLIVNPDEAAMVRDLFDLYLQHESLLKVADIGNSRGWMTKSWVRKDGIRHEGRPLDKTKVSTILRNPTYRGMVRHRAALLPGEHEAVVEEATFRQVQAMLDGNGNEGGRLPHGKHPGLLQGLLKCGCCGAAMTSTYTKKKGGRLYRYYQCLTRGKRGKDACPAPYLPAQDIEDLVVGEIRKLARDDELARAVFQEAAGQQRALIPRLQTERQRLVRDRQAKSEQIQRLLAVLATTDTPQPSVSERLAELEGIVGKLNGRLTEIDSELSALDQNCIDPDDVARTLAQFDELWDVLYPQERSRLVRSLISTITYEATGEVRIALNPGAIWDLG